MPRFLVSHKVNQLFDSQDQWLRDWGAMRKRAAQSPGSKAQWLSSWYAAQPNKLFCEWEADDEASIRASFTPEQLAMAPIASVDEVVHIDPAWLDDEAREPMKPAR
jgi:hypothetical protein